MYSDEKQIIMRVVEHYAKTGQTDDEQVKVICLPEGKSSFVETIGEDGRSVQLDEYHVGDKTIWAGYSVRSETVFLSPARLR
jgi:hypothetical protein